MELVCDDFLGFQESLRILRKMDDNIAHSLNSTIPTASFAVKGIDATAQCSDLHSQLTKAHNSREEAIKKCILKVSGRVQCLRARREQDEENAQLRKELRQEQNKLRLMQNELNVEEVVRDRTKKIFHERCRSYFRE